MNIDTTADNPMSREPVNGDAVLFIKNLVESTLILADEERKDIMKLNLHIKLCPLLKQLFSIWIMFIIILNKIYE